MRVLIQYNINSLRNNTDTKVKYNNTADIAPDSFVKSTAIQPTNVQNVSFGSKIEEIKKIIEELYIARDNLFRKIRKAKNKGNNPKNAESHLSRINRRIGGLKRELKNLPNVD